MLKAAGRIDAARAGADRPFAPQRPAAALFFSILSS
jgi:hypothetical protein